MSTEKQLSLCIFVNICEHLRIFVDICVYLRIFVRIWLNFYFSEKLRDWNLYQLGSSCQLASTQVSTFKQLSSNISEIKCVTVGNLFHFYSYLKVFNHTIMWSYKVQFLVDLNVIMIQKQCTQQKQLQ